MRLSRSHIIAYFISAIVLIILIIQVVDYFSVEEKAHKAAIDIDSKKKLDIIFGNDNAELSVYMYASYNCSYCRKFFTEVFPELKNSFIDNGLVNIVMRLTTKTRDQRMKRALKAAACVNRYGNFEYLHKLLLHNPKVVFTWEFQEMIDEFSMKDPFVGECIDGKEALKYLESNITEFEQLNLKGTPGFVIENTVYQGYRPAKRFKAIIKQHLQKLKTDV